SNLVGVGVLQALSGWRGPTVDAGMIGDLPFATSDVGDLPRISLSPREMGVRAAARLVARLRGEAGEPAVLPPDTRPDAASAPRCRLCASNRFLRGPPHGSPGGPRRRRRHVQHEGGAGDR